MIRSLPRCRHRVLLSADSARPRESFESREEAFDSAPDRGALVFVEYEVTYRIHYRTGVRSMHAKAEKQAQPEPVTQGEREGGRTDGRVTILIV